MSLPDVIVCVTCSYSTWAHLCPEECPQCAALARIEAGTGETREAGLDGEATKAGIAPTLGAAQQEGERQPQSISSDGI